jgi:hypothetical protein
VILLRVRLSFRAWTVCGLYFNIKSRLGGIFPSREAQLMQDPGVSATSVPLDYVREAGKWSSLSLCILQVLSLLLWNVDLDMHPDPTRGFP